jgi:SAM-dependent methyltransferase
MKNTDKKGRHMQTARYTRGRGLLEPFLAKLRANRANRLIPVELRTGRILDVGCGTYPYFLSHSYFEQKFAIEKSPRMEETTGINWYYLDLNKSASLPFENEYFTTITLLAVIEHLDPSALVELLKECHRLLTFGGVLILTTPSVWSNGILKFMARISLVSEEEINEHKFSYNLPLIGWYFGISGFEMTGIKFGYFEMMLNMWAVAKK